MIQTKQTKLLQPHLTHSVIMVYPSDFGFNPETGVDNEFQHSSQQQPSQIKHQAQQEFEQMVKKLSAHNIEVLRLKHSQTKIALPDAVFPNNWFATRADGSLYIFPMKTANRQAEVKPELLSKILTDANYLVSSQLDVSTILAPASKVLEGTGSLVFHHPSQTVFAALSERCDLDLLQDFCQSQGFQAISFNAFGATGKPIYHTNVMMSCGEQFAVVAAETVTDPQQNKQLLTAIEQRVEDLIIISEAQMRQYFCANILQLKNRDQQNCIVLSQSAYQGFTASQLKILESHGELIVCNIPTIEHIGGGSARCMLAENFLPKAKT
jgi:hypothetical protein